METKPKENRNYLPRFRQKHHAAGRLIPRLPAVSLRGTILDMRILVTGDRYWFNNKLAFAIVRRLVERYGPDIVIVHGAASGGDESFELACRGLGVKTEPHAAEWDRLGKAAGPLRNQLMVDSGAALCIALHRSIATSRGTKDCLKRAIEAGIPSYVIESEAAAPRRVRVDDPRLQ